MSGTRRYRLIVIFAMLLVTSCFTLNGQGVTNTSNIYIEDGLELHIDGDLSSAGFIQNQGNLFVSGNWRNTNVYQGLGIITLNGIQVQDFWNNKNAVHHLVIHGEGRKNIINTLPITNRFDLFSGIVHVSDDDTLLLANGITIGGGSPISYVDGALTHTGTGFKYFPIGKNGGFYPAELTNITGVNPVTELEVHENLPAINAPSSITLYNSIYWQRKTISGTFTGSPLVLGTQMEDDRTNRYVIEILQSDDLGSPFTTLGTTSVSYGDDIDKVSTDVAATGKIFVIGETIPVDGIPGEFYLSTSLSPQASNADNRAVKVFGNKFVEDSFQLLVYNRWGLVVFETSSLQQMLQTGWDGRHKSGDILPSGAYPFVMRGVTKTGETVEKKGVISIVN
jgi:hypothetical protein